MHEYWTKPSDDAETTLLMCGDEQIAVYVCADHALAAEAIADRLNDEIESPIEVEFAVLEDTYAG